MLSHKSQHSRAVAEIQVCRVPHSPPLNLRWDCHLNSVIGEIHYYYEQTDKP